MVDPPIVSIFSDSATIVGEGCEPDVKNSQHANEPSQMSGRKKAIALFSGGLDSILAAVLMQRLGVDTTLLHVQHLWSGGEAARRKIRAAAARVGLPLRIVDASEEHLDVVRYPKHGYGSAVNPCVDCHIFMLRVGQRVMEEENADFVVTGEVLGQRPKSQHYGALRDVAEESGLGERLVRPLSANLLPETLPVREGWLRREDLLSLRGRGREPQFALAAEFGIRDFPQPAGGCLLTEKAYAARVFDAFAHLGKDAVGEDEFSILCVGRHFRLSDRVKVVVGRDEGENEFLAGFAAGRILVLPPPDVMGPSALIEGSPTEEELRVAASLVARYCDHEGDAPIEMDIVDNGTHRTVAAAPLEAADSRFTEWRIEDRALRARRARTP
jgi:tRNA-specific 2-thiouridylase